MPHLALRNLIACPLFFLGSAGDRGLVVAVVFRGIRRHRGVRAGPHVPGHRGVLRGVVDDGAVRADALRGARG